MKKYAMVIATVAITSLISSTAATQQKGAKLSPEAARGKYIVQIAGCNDCHTPGYTASAGKVEEKLWPYRRPARLAGPLGYDVCLQPAPPREAHVGGPVREPRAQRGPPANAVVQPSRDDRPRRQGDLRLPEASRHSRPACAAIRPGRQNASRTFFVQFPEPPK